jgi:hypothetical protein
MIRSQHTPVITNKVVVPDLKESNPASPIPRKLDRGGGRGTYAVRDFLAPDVGRVK